MSVKGKSTGVHIWDAALAGKGAVTAPVVVAKAAAAAADPACVKRIRRKPRGKKFCWYHVIIRECPSIYQRRTLETKDLRSSMEGSFAMFN